MNLPQVFALLLTLLSRSGLLFSCLNNSAAKHYCGSSLSDALFSICTKNNDFVARNFVPRTEFNRSTGGIIEECCINRCSKQQLSQYCQTKVGRISMFGKSKKRERSQRFIDTNKISKSKRSPSSSCTCGNRQKKNRLIRFTTNKNRDTPTTEKQFAAEVHYIDDWTGDEHGQPFLLNKN